MKLKSHFETTGIGSLPYEDEEEACNIVFSNFRKIPFWPQLVKKSFLEDMMVQFSERMPGIEVDNKKKRVYINRRRDIKKEIEETNKRYYSEDFEYFSFSEDYAAGFYEFIKRLKDNSEIAPDYLKGQITGPISLSFTIADEEGIPLFFDKALCDAAVNALSARARWQGAKLKRFFKDVIIFIDEPSLIFFKKTASDSKIKKETLFSYVNRVIDAIHEEACYAGIHCCADADWDFVLSTKIDIISVDAYNYGDSFVKSHKRISNFLKRGGIIAWGIIPTVSSAGDTPKRDIESLIEILERQIDFLSTKDIDRKRLIHSSLITPSCGCGALRGEDAEEVIKQSIIFSQLAKERIK